MNILLANNAETTLTAAIAAGDLTVPITSATNFPSPTSGVDAFYVTLERVTTGEKEIVLCTARSGLNLTVVRAREGTSAISFASGDIVSMRLTKAALEAVTPRRNLVINGAMQVAQAATSYVATTSLAYGCVDQWFMKQATLAEVTFSQAAPSPALPGFEYCLKVLLTGTSTGQISFGTIFESRDSIPYQGRRVKVIVRAVKGSTWNPANVEMRLWTGTGTDQSSANMIAGAWTGSAQSLSSTLTPTATWDEYTFDVTIPSTATQIGMELRATPTGAAVDANSYLMVTGFEIKEGVSPFEARPYEQELALCHRYLPGFNGLSDTFAGHEADATTGYIAVPFPVPARIAPTGITISNVVHLTARHQAATIVATNVQFSRAGKRSAMLLVTVAAGLTAGNGWTTYLNDAAAKLLFTGAQL